MFEQEALDRVGDVGLFGTQAVEKGLAGVRVEIERPVSQRAHRLPQPRVPMTHVMTPRTNLDCEERDEATSPGTAFQARLTAQSFILRRDYLSDRRVVRVRADMTDISRRDFVALTAAGAVATPFLLDDALARGARR